MGAGGGGGGVGALVRRKFANFCQDIMLQCKTFCHTYLCIKSFTLFSAFKNIQKIPSFS